MVREEENAAINLILQSFDDIFPKRNEDEVMPRMQSQVDECESDGNETHISTTQSLHDIDETPPVDNVDLYENLEDMLSKNEVVKETVVSPSKVQYKDINSPVREQATPSMRHTSCPSSHWSDIFMDSDGFQRVYTRSQMRNLRKKTEES